MLKKVTIRLHDDIYEELVQESKERRISLTDLLREIVIQRKTKSISGEEKEILPKENEQNKTELDLVAVETLFLLRQFLMEKGQQPYSKAHDMMTKKFGPDWKKL